MAKIYGLTEIFDSAIITGDLTVDTTSLYVNSTDSTVGIGTVSTTSGFVMTVGGRMYAQGTGVHSFEVLNDSAVNVIQVIAPDVNLGLTYSFGVHYSTNDVNNAAGTRTFAKVSGWVDSRTASSVSGGLAFGTTEDGTMATSPIERMTIFPNGDIDMDTTTFFMDASTNRVGIGTTGPSSTFHVSGDFRLEDGSESSGYVLISDGTGVASWTASSGIADGNGIYDGSGTLSSGTTTVTIPSASTIKFTAALGELMSLSSGGPVVINDSGASAVDFRAESDTNPYMFFLDAGTDKIGINTSFPSATLNIQGDDTSGSSYGFLVENSFGTDAMIIQNDSKIGFGVTPNTLTSQSEINVAQGYFMQFDSPNNSNNYGGIKFIEVASSFSNYGGKIFYNANSGSKHLYLTTQNLGTIGGGIAIYRTGGRVQIFAGTAVRTAIPGAQCIITGAGTGTGRTFEVESSTGSVNLKVLDNGRVSMANLPTSAIGLSAGDLWNNSGVVNIV